MNCFAPIVLFVYNRPDHTRLTVEALRRNELASESELLVYSDAPKNEQAEPDVKKVRDYIHSIDGFKKVIVVERAKNWGLAASIIDGVTRIVNQYGKVIVLEDDLETSPYFLNFMNDALNYYENIPEVMHISGCRYPVEPFGTDHTFFLHVPLCWGWATWQRAWQFFDKDIAIMERFNRQEIRRFDFGDNYAYWRQLELNKSGVLNTWFIFWYANLFLRSGLALFPARSLVQNIGMDKSGTHSGITDDYNVALSGTPIHLAKIPLVESSEGYEFHRRYFKKIKVGLVKRVVRKLRYFLKKLDI